MNGTNIECCQHNCLYYNEFNLYSNFIRYMFTDIINEKKMDLVTTKKKISNGNNFLQDFCKHLISSLTNHLFFHLNVAYIEIEIVLVELEIWLHNITGAVINVYTFLHCSILNIDSQTTCEI